MTRRGHSTRDELQADRHPLPAAIAAIVRPLEFAARDDFAHMAKVSALERSLERACDTVLAFRLPADLRRMITGLRAEFSNPLEFSARVVAVRGALEKLSPLSDPAWPEAVLARPLSVLPGIGPKRAEALARKGLRTIEDLLFHLPSRYDDRRALCRVEDLEVGRRATFMAEVKLADFVTQRGGRRARRLFQAVVGDETGTVHLKWFRAPDALTNSVRKGQWLLVTGDVKRYRFAKELVHPETEPIDSPAVSAAHAPAVTDSPAVTDTPAATDASAAKADKAPLAAAPGTDDLREIVPDYPSIEGVNGRTLRRWIAAAVDDYADLVPGWLPEALVEERDLPPAARALVDVHRPDPESDVRAYRERDSPAYQRLVMEELYLLEMGLALRRHEAGVLPGISIPPDAAFAARAAAALPFELTGAQRRVLEEIRVDLARPHPMNRLLQGDVGSGKTAVAFLAAVAVSHAGHQTALMAPTELLAEQHERTLRSLAARAEGELRIARLSASMPKGEADRVRAGLAAGEVDLVVGTHALVQPDVAFANLALAIIDEQHRFGVRQRAALAGKTRDELHPHALVMTATPIPRTLSLTLYGDLDVSVIDEHPPGRKTIETLLLRDGEGRRLTDMVRATVDRGEQVYVVYPLVEESEHVDLRSAMESASRIRHAFGDVGVDLVHGRLDAESRAQAMARFSRGETRILVSTTVIEVGVDVPGATLMVIEHAERFGLAQLHQLRGRVGRGDAASACVLVARGGSETSEARFRAMLDTNDGFAIADADLRLRGPGEFLGTRQSGHLPDLRIADLVRDAELVAAARNAALATVASDPGLSGDPELLRAVLARWGDRLELVNVG